MLDVLTSAPLLAECQPTYKQMLEVGVRWVKDGWRTFRTYCRLFAPRYCPSDDDFDLHFNAYDGGWGSVRGALWKVSLSSPPASRLV
jgi:hypothetical protein